MHTETVYSWKLKTFLMLTHQKFIQCIMLVAHFTWKYFLTSAENDLFMIDIIMNMKYISQIPVEKIYAICRKNCIKKCCLVNITKT